MTETHAFQAEVQKLLDLMVHSLYSNKDIFLRELISNASDALDKLRYEQLTREDLRTDRALEIEIETDRANRTLTIKDSGIGMSREEVVQNLGTIARSGTEELRKRLAEAKASGSPELIGQFGVGFYSSFMVAEEVTVVTRRAGEVTATEWRSRGDGRYTVDDATRTHHGTTVTLKLKPADEEASLHDYTEESQLRSIVRRYSDFVAYPIKLQVWRDDEKSKVPVLETVTLNSMKAIWSRPKSEVTDQELQDFYRHVSHDWTAPLRSVFVRIEGNFEASALLFIPARAPHDLYHAEMRRGVHLYVKRVFIMDDARELMPSWLRFVRGVCDAQDLPLNVSREILQKSRQVQAIRKQLTRRVLDTLAELQKDALEDYKKFWVQFGPVLKEGLVGEEAGDREKLLGLLMLGTTHGDADTTLEGYVGRMKPEQESIYVLTGSTAEALRSSPLLEGFREKGYEVLLLSDGIDEVWLEREPTFQGKSFRSINRGDVELGSKEEREKTKEALDSRAGELRGLFNVLRAALQDDVKEVRLTNRLTRSPACLVMDEGDLSPQLERLMAAMGQGVPRTKRILELNGEHPLVRSLDALHRADPSAPLLTEYAQLLYGQALLSEGQALRDPSSFAQQVVDLMLRAAPATPPATPVAPAPAAEDPPPAV